MTIIQVATTPDILARARSFASSIGLRNNSITAGDGNMAGAVGKYIVAEYLKTSITKTYDYDMLYQGKRIEVKTKRCSSRPFPNYECSIAEYNPNQKCDFYVFTRVLNDYSLGWILGVMAPKEYMGRATVEQAGSHDSSNNFTFHCKSFNVQIAELYDFCDTFGVDPPATPGAAANNDGHNPPRAPAAGGRPSPETSKAPSLDDWMTSGAR